MRMPVIGWHWDRCNCVRCIGRPGLALRFRVVRVNQTAEIRHVADYFAADELLATICEANPGMRGTVNVGPSIYEGGPPCLASVIFSDDHGNPDLLRETVRVAFEHAGVADRFLPLG